VVEGSGPRQEMTSAGSQLEEIAMPCYEKPVHQLMPNHKLSGDVHANVTGVRNRGDEKNCT
jgi:hypothetical protein